MGPGLRDISRITQPSANLFLPHHKLPLTWHCASVSVLSITSCSVEVLEAEACVSLQKLSHQPHPEDALGVGISSFLGPQKPGSDFCGNSELYRVPKQLVQNLPLT